MIIDRLKRVAASATQAYKEEKAHLQGKAISKARMLLQASSIPEVRKHLGEHGDGAPQPVPGANIRTYSGKVLTFFTDGSLRSPLGARPKGLSGRQARKAQKRLRRWMKSNPNVAARVREALA